MSRMVKRGASALQVLTLGSFEPQGVQRGLMMDRVSLVKRPGLSVAVLDADFVEFVPADSDTGRWVRGFLTRVSTTGNAWVREMQYGTGAVLLALPSEVRVYR